MVLEERQMRGHSRVKQCVFASCTYHSLSTCHCWHHFETVKEVLKRGEDHASDELLTFMAALNMPVMTCSAGSRRNTEAS